MPAASPTAGGPSIKWPPSVTVPPLRRAALPRNHRTGGRNPVAGHTVALNGIKVCYETYGQGEPLPLLPLHGNGQSIAAFNGQIPALAQHYRVIAVDTRAQGQSTNGKQTLTYDLFAEDMSALFTALNIPAAHVAGWSDGGNKSL